MVTWMFQNPNRNNRFDSFLSGLHYQIVDFVFLKSESMPKLHHNPSSNTESSFSLGRLKNYCENSLLKLILSTNKLSV